MSGADKKPNAGRKPGQKSDRPAVRADGSLGDVKFKQLKRPVNADAFLVDRRLSPEEEGLAGPLPEEEENGPKSGK